jgi:hypothetical protein
MNAPFAALAARWSVTGHHGDRFVNFYAGRTYWIAKQRPIHGFVQSFFRFALAGGAVRFTPKQIGRLAIANRPKSMFS